MFGYLFSNLVSLCDFVDDSLDLRYFLQENHIGFSFII